MATAETKKGGDTTDQNLDMRDSERARDAGEAGEVVAPPAVGETILYHPADGRETVEANVLSVNEDGSVNLEYPHFADAAAWATADNVLNGTGGYHWQRVGEPNPTAAPDGDGDLQRQLDEARAQVGSITSQAAIESADLQKRIAELEKDVASHKARADKAEAELAVLTGGEKKDPDLQKPADTEAKDGAPKDEKKS